MDKDRFGIGMEKLKEIDGRAGEAVAERLAGIAPDFGRFLVESFGEIYSRPGLDMREREIAVIAGLTVLGHAQPQLKVHVAAGLNVGLSQDVIVEIITQMVLYAGFPACLNALFTAGEVFDAQA